MIKFRYVYSNGKEIKTFIYTIEEIENEKMSEDWYEMEVRGFKLISRDRFTGLIVKDKELFENDIFHLGDIRIKYVVEWLDTGLKGRQMSNKSTVGLEYHKKWIEIISSTHIEELKDNK